MGGLESNRRDDAVAEAWRKHELSQLLDFRALSLREKLQAIEGMADLVHRFEQMRREGAFRSGASEQPSPSFVETRHVTSPTRKS